MCSSVLSAIYDYLKNKNMWPITDGLDGGIDDEMDVISEETRPAVVQRPSNDDSPTVVRSSSKKLHAVDAVHSMEEPLVQYQNSKDNVDDVGALPIFRNKLITDRILIDDNVDSDTKEFTELFETFTNKVDHFVCTINDSMDRVRSNIIVHKELSNVLTDKLRVMEKAIKIPQKHTIKSPDIMKSADEQNTNTEYKGYEHCTETLLCSYMEHRLKTLEDQKRINDDRFNGLAINLNNCNKQLMSAENDCKYLSFKHSDLINMCGSLKYQLVNVESDLSVKVDRVEQKINQLMSDSTDKICFIP